MAMKAARRKHKETFNFILSCHEFVCQPIVS